MFDVNTKDIPYYDLQRSREIALFEYQYKHVTAQTKANVGEYVSS